jgi:hypothetical protein
LDTSEGHEATLKDLAEAIELECSIPVNRQKLICKGKIMDYLQS